eukprot:Pgem_evm1s687
MSFFMSFSFLLIPCVDSLCFCCFLLGGLVRGAERAGDGVSDTLKARKASGNEMDLKLERVKGKYRPGYKKLDQKEQLRIVRGKAGRLIQDALSDVLAFARKFDIDAAVYQLNELERGIVDLVDKNVLGRDLLNKIKFLQQNPDAAVYQLNELENVIVDLVDEKVLGRGLLNKIKFLLKKRGDINNICDYIRRIHPSVIKKNKEDSWEKVHSCFTKLKNVIPHQTVGDMPIPKRQLVRHKTVLPKRQLKTVFHKPGLGDTIARAPPIDDTPIPKRQLVRHNTVLPNDDKPGLEDTIARAPPIDDTPIPQRKLVRHNTVLSDDYKPGLGDNIMA